MHSIYLQMYICNFSEHTRTNRVKYNFSFQLHRVPVQPRRHRRPAVPTVRAKRKRKLLRPLAPRSHDEGQESISIEPLFSQESMSYPIWD